METITFKKERFVESFGVRITVDVHGFKITADPRHPPRMLTVEIYARGRLRRIEVFNSSNCFCWTGFIDGFDPAECGLLVLDMQGNCVVMLDVEEDQFPFMKPQGEQLHVTENYVSIPPALTITDESGCIWSLGVGSPYAPKHKSPDGEFALPVMRNGIDTLELASRIERRGSKIKIFTCEGWKVWTGRSWF